MAKNTATVPESFPMNGGHGTYSYTKNSEYQREASKIVKVMVDEAIAEMLDIKSLSCTSNIIRIADLGCSVGPNTFIAMQNVLETMEQKYLSQGLTSQIPEFQVFFNDHASNDFNTLFTSLPPERQYFAAGIPGSFHGRLFPESSLHFVYSSYALQWLSKVPEELLDKSSPSWNKGRVHYTNAPDEVTNAYATQYAKDMEIFLNARAKEVVVGGMMVLIMIGIPNGIPHSRVPAGLMFDCMGSTLMDMAKAGLISEAQVDSFNLPLYAASPTEMAGLVERNGCFNIERMELTNPALEINAPINVQQCVMHIRAGMEGVFSRHFGSAIMDELFERYNQKAAKVSDQLNSSYREGTQLFVVMKRK